MNDKNKEETDSIEKYSQKKYAEALARIEELENQVKNIMELSN